jgi:P4 family phage/plasmid primase-like protien
MTTDQYIGSSLHRFLEDRRVWKKGPGQDVSMTGMGANKGNWTVSDEDYPQFMDLMHEWLFIKDLRPNNFVEQRKPDGVTPLLIDLDFAYPPEKNLERTFTKENIQSFVAEAAAVLKENFDLKDRQTVRFFVTLRPNPYPNKGTSKHIKDGIHILCPDITLTPEFQGLVRQLMLEREAVKKSFGETGYINHDDIVFDESLTKKQGWLFYGESKPDIPPYTLKHVFKYTPKTEKMTETKDIDAAYKPRDLIELLSIRHKLQPSLSLLEGRKDVLKEVLAKMHTPSQNHHNQLVPHHGAAVATQEEVTGYLPILMDSFNNIVSTEDEIALAKRLAIECLNEERASGYDSWMRVGWCLRNIDSSESMFDAWMEFSNKSGKSAGNNTEQLRKDWIRGSMRHVNGSPGLKMGSLKMWAREDNPTRYMEIMDGDIISFIQKTAITFKGGTHYHVAKMIHKLYPDVYKCFVDGRTTEWYEFKDHVWHPMPSGILIKTTITDDLTLKVDSARRSLKGPDDKAEEYDELMKKYQENIIKLLKLQENLYNANFKDSVMKEAAQIFYDPDFHKHLDQNVYAIGCSNGILNLREPVFDDQGRPVRYKPTLRPGTAQDYVSLQTGVTPDGLDPIPYIPYDPNDPIQTEIMDFFKKIFPADDLREYVLTLAAGCLEAANKEQCFYIMTGSGGNGKSKFVELMCSVLGQYAGSLATTALTRKRPDSGAANPDVMSVKNARFIEMKEPDEGEPINSARMKQFSGEDLVEARGLFKDQERFKIRGKIFMACNRLPPMHSMDGGTWRRIRVIPFDSRFLAAGDPMIDPSRNIYPRDDMMDEKLKSWRVPFFSLLVHYYETKYCPHGIKKVPAIVMQACENYKGNFDSFGKFIKSRIRKVVGYDDPPQFKDLWKAYKNWHMEQNATGKKLTENELRIRLNELYQAPADGKTYLHLRLFYGDEEAEEFDKELADWTSASNC